MCGESDTLDEIWKAMIGEECPILWEEYETIINLIEERSDDV